MKIVNILEKFLLKCLGRCKGYFNILFKPYSKNHKNFNQIKLLMIKISNFIKKRSTIFEV